MAREIRRLNINMPVELIDRIDEYAERMSINRTSAVNVLCNTALDAQQSMNTLEELTRLLRENQLHDSETKKSKQ